MNIQICKNLQYTQDKQNVADYFGINAEDMDSIQEKVTSIVLVEGYHTFVEDLKYLDEEFTQSGENLYAKFVYGQLMGILQCQGDTNIASGKMQ